MMTDSRDAKIELIKKSYNQEKIADIAKNDPDWHVRIVAVEHVNNENVLKEIVNTELTSSVAIKAMENINDIEFLSGICLNHPDSYLRLACINRISDESLFPKEELASLLDGMLLNDSDEYVLKSVCENPNLVNQKVLIEAAKSTDSELLKRSAIKKIINEDILTDFALNDKNPYVRREAILNPNLVSLNALYEIIRLDDNEFNRIMAIYKIPNKESLLEMVFKKPLQYRLSEIAQNTTFSLNDYFLNILKNGSDEYKRQVAVNFITDEDVLEDIISNEANDSIRADAIGNKNFANQTVLEKLISCESNAEILFEVVCKIESQDALTEYVRNHLEYNEVIVKAVSRLNDLELLEKLVVSSDSRIRLESVRRISKIENSRYILRNVALTEDEAEICFEAINAMDIRNDLIEVASNRLEKEIRMAALKNIKSKRLLDNYLGLMVQNSSNNMSFESNLRNMALSDDDGDIRRIATAKLDEKDILVEIASSDDISSLEAQKRLDSLFEDIKCIKDERILNRLVSSDDGDVSNIALRQLEDLETWKGRIAKISEINDVDVLKDISANDFNYLVRNEAEGKLEKLLFNIRLDEIDSDSNQEKLKNIVVDESFSLEIRRKALLKITDEEFLKNFEDITE